MYCEYWKLKKLPFENVPDPSFVFYSPNHDESLMRLFYTVKGRKGACMLTGEVGCGKTTISTVFQEKLKNGNFEVGLITNPNLSNIELLQEILYKLGANGHHTKKLELIHALHDKVLENLKAKRETVVVIDEAHLIREEETYEELRLLLNLQDKNRFLFTLVLVGQPELKALIGRIPQLSQRIPIKYHLPPLNFIETFKYVQFRLRRAGNQGNIFTGDAAKEIYAYSGGIPRKINNICDMSLLAGFVEQARVINRAIIKKVIEDEG
jgi:general secretion pathway protein A